MLGLCPPERGAAEVLRGQGGAGAMKGTGPPGAPQRIGEGRGAPLACEAGSSRGVARGGRRSERALRGGWKKLVYALCERFQLTKGASLPSMTS
jgi:hypothetical protein